MIFNVENISFGRENSFVKKRMDEKRVKGFRWFKGLSKKKNNISKLEIAFLQKEHS